MNLSNLADYTMAQVLRRNAQNFASGTAMRRKSRGIWKTMNWGECQERVECIAMGLRGIGAKPGTVVAILCRNSPELILSQLAAQVAGAATLVIHSDCTSEEVGSMLLRSAASFVVAHDEEQVDKILDAGSHADGVRQIVHLESRGLGRHACSRLLALSSLERIGLEARRADPGAYEAMLSKGRAEDVQHLVATSGTTGEPKIAAFSNRAWMGLLLSQLAADPKMPEDEYVCLAPLSALSQQVIAAGGNLVAGMKLNFVEDAQTAHGDMREIGPTVGHHAARHWQQVARQAQAHMANARGLRRLLFRVGMHFGERSLRRGSRSVVFSLLVGGAMRDRLGLSRLRMATTAGLPVSQDVIDFFGLLGVPLRVLYEQTELGGVCTSHVGRTDERSHLGKPLPGLELRIENPDAAGTGELVARRAGMSAAWYGQDSQLTLAAGGWVRTGDTARIDADGQLAITDRTQDILVDVRGRMLSPQQVEIRLAASPYIAECAVLALNDEGACVAVCIEYASVAKWAEERRIEFNSYASLASSDEVIGLIRRELESLNARALSNQKVSRFALMHKNFDPDDGDLTRDGKLRRHSIAGRYPEVAGALRDAVAGSCVHVDDTIRLRDGRIVRIATTVAVHAAGG